MGTFNEDIQNAIVGVFFKKPDSLEIELMYFIHILLNIFSATIEVLTIQCRLFGTL